MARFGRLGGLGITFPSDVLAIADEVDRIATVFVRHVAYWQIVFSNSGSGRQVLRDHPCRATVLSAVGLMDLRMMALGDGGSSMLQSRSAFRTLT